MESILSISCMIWSHIILKISVGKFSGFFIRENDWISFKFKIIFVSTVERTSIEDDFCCPAILLINAAFSFGILFFFTISKSWVFEGFFIGIIADDLIILLGIKLICSVIMMNLIDVAGILCI